VNELNERRTRAGQYPYDVIPDVEVYELDHVTIVYTEKWVRNIKAISIVNAPSASGDPVLPSFWRKKFGASPHLSQAPLC